LDEVRAPSYLGPNDLDRLAADGRIETIVRRAILPLDRPTLVVVIDGYFRIFRNAAFARDVTLGLASQGDVLGAAAAFGGRSAESGAEALSEAHVLLISPDRWAERAAAEPDLYIKMAYSLGRRVSSLQRRIASLGRVGVEGRVAAGLLELADGFGRPAAGGVRLDLPLSQDDLARLAGTTRETCSSVVAEFARRGLVRGGRLRGLVLIDREALAVLAGI
jgi:CRP/FNR family transcriptional regulator